jgi:hypothetical protein
LANVVGQLFLMSQLLGIRNYHYLGFEILGRMGKGVDLVSNHYFPKVSHCDFKVRELGNDHHYTVQCVLAINIFTEKMYVILWFWFVILAVLTAVDLIRFLANSVLRGHRYRYVSKHVKIFNNVEDDEEVDEALEEFAVEYLKQDVVFVLRLLSHNINSIVVSELVDHLWKSFLHTKGINESIVDMTDASASDAVVNNSRPTLHRMATVDHDSMLKKDWKLDNRAYYRQKSFPANEAHSSHNQSNHNVKRKKGRRRGIMSRLTSRMIIRRMR